MTLIRNNFEQYAQWTRDFSQKKKKKLKLQKLIDNSQLFARKNRQALNCVEQS